MCFNSHQMSAPVGIPKVNKFEQVLSDGHQMSGREPVSKVQCIMSNGDMGPPPREQADK